MIVNIWWDTFHLILRMALQGSTRYPQEFWVKSNSKNISWDTQNKNCIPNEKYTEVFKIMYSDAPELILFAAAKGMALSLLGAALPACVIKICDDWRKFCPWNTSTLFHLILK